MDCVSSPRQLWITTFVRTESLRVFVRLASRFAFNTGILNAIFRLVCTRAVLAVEDLVEDPWGGRGRRFPMSLVGKSGCSPRYLARLGEGVKIGRCTLVVSLGSSDIHECNNVGL